MSAPRISPGRKIGEESVEENVAVGRVNASTQSFTNGELGELQLDSEGNLKVTLFPLVDTVTVNRGGTNYRALVVDTEINLQADNLTISNVTISSGTIGSTGSSVTVGNVVPVSQHGTWTTGRTWTLASGTDSITIGQMPSIDVVIASGNDSIIIGNVVQTNRNWTLASGTDNVGIGNFPSEYPSNNASNIFTS